MRHGYTMWRRRTGAGEAKPDETPVEDGGCTTEKTRCRNPKAG